MFLHYMLGIYVINKNFNTYSNIAKVNIESGVNKYIEKVKEPEPNKNDSLLYPVAIPPWEKIYE